MKHFWKQQELDKLKSLIDLKVTATTNAYYIGKAFKDESLYQKIGSEALYNGILKATKQLKEEQKEKENKNILETSSEALVQIYNKIEKRNPQWYSVNDLVRFVDNTQILSNNEAGCCVILGKLLTDFGFNSKRQNSGIFYFLDSEMYHKKLLDEGILIEIKDDYPKPKMEKVVIKKKQDTTSIRVFQIEDIPVGIIKSKFMTLKFKKCVEFLVSLKNKSQNVYYTDKLVLYLKHQNCYFYEFEDISDRKYVLDWLEEINKRTGGESPL